MFNILLTVVDNPYKDIPYEVDFETVRMVQKITGDIVGTMLGIAAGFIVIGLFIITVLDICYMMIPPLQEVIRGKGWDGAVDNGSKFRLVSKDAIHSVREAYVSGRSALLYYLGKRLKTYVIAAIILFVIVSGSKIIVDLSVKLVSGLLKLLKII